MILSPFTNSTLRSQLQFRDYGFVKKKIVNLLGLSARIGNFKDVAPWIGQLIEELEKLENVEVFSVSPHIKLKKKIQCFRYGKTTYYFFSSDYSSGLRLVKNYKVWKSLQNCSTSVCMIADEIKPDVIIAYGTENPVVSVSQLYLKKKYPVFCVLQTIYNNPERTKYGTPNKLIQELELDIARNIKYFGTEDDVYFHLLKGMNPNVIAFDYPYPRVPLPAIELPEKKFDFVNYAFNMDARKGDEDAVRALAIVKEKYPQVTLNIAGGMSSAREAYIKNMVTELGLIDNITFTPMFERKEDMYRHILQARYALLPIKLDLVSTTIRESMYYKLPIVTYVTPGTPALNKKKQCVLLAEKENVESLAERMKEIMSDDNLAARLATNAHEYIVHQMDNRDKMKRIMKALEAIIENYRYGSSIPEALLYNTNK